MIISDRHVGVVYLIMAVNMTPKSSMAIGDWGYRCSESLLLHILYLEAVWRSRNLERLYKDIYLYIYIVIRANLRPPCWRYRDIENTKKGNTCFLALQYFQPFGSHATSNFSICRYIYIITVILQPTFLKYGDGSYTKITQP